MSNLRKLVNNFRVNIPYTFLFELWSYAVKSIRMCCGKVILLCLVLCGTSLAEEKKQSYAKNITECLKSKDIEDRSANVTKCLIDMFDTKLSNKTNLSCSNFNDFNQTLINFVNYTIKTCYNATITKLSAAQNTFGRILKLITEDDIKEYIKHLDCITKRKEEFKQCYKLEERNYTSSAHRWLSRVNLNFDKPACPRTKKAKTCTSDIMSKDCPPTMKILGDRMFSTALDNCDTEELNWKPTDAADIARFSYVLILTIVIAFIV